jgi:hypothetical protein
MEMKVSFKEQFSFADCIYKKPLPFDFAIFINSKILLIEYQGEQHYKHVGFGGKNTPSLLEAVKMRDRIKKEYAKNKQIPLLLISHKEFDEIDSLIRNFLEEN